MRPAPEGLLFGTAGVPHSAAADSTVSGIQRVRELGLDCLEVEFVRGVHMDAETAAAVRRAAEKHGVRLSVHAPYFINLNAADEGKRLQSQERLLKSARTAAACGAVSVVFHAGYYGESAPEQTGRAVRDSLSRTASIIRRELLPVSLRIETMGKRSQFGSLDEVLSLCREVEGLKPCLDFSHIYAREGRVNSYGEFERVLAKVAKKLGLRALHDLHIHIAGVHYGGAGELKHLNLEEADFRYDEWLEALRDCGASGMVVCESPNLERDALMLQALYRGLVSKEEGRAGALNRAAKTSLP
jgi:deoxyribonuclease-4